MRIATLPDSKHTTGEVYADGYKGNWRVLGKLACGSVIALHHTPFKAEAETVARYLNGMGNSGQHTLRYFLDNI